MEQTPVVICTAGDIGVDIDVSPGPGLPNLTGATCVLLASPHDGPVRTLGTMTVSEDGTTARYVTTGRDFTVGGEWMLQLQVKPSGGSNKFTSPQTRVIVNQLL